MKENLSYPERAVGQCCLAGIPVVRFYGCPNYTGSPRVAWIAQHLRFLTSILLLTFFLPCLFYNLKIYYIF